MKIKAFKRILLLTFIFSVSFSLSYGQKSKVVLTNAIDSISYIIGLDLISQGIDINVDAMKQAAIDTKTGQYLIDISQKQVLIQKLVKDLQQSKIVAEKAKGKEFLEKNLKEKGVKATASGLQYKVITEGKGKSPSATDTVKVHYKGTLIDGTKFDASYDRNEPISFPLNGVIKGWTEGLQLMKAGGKYMLFIPSGLAYGDRGAPPTIPGGATLIFEVELLEINPTSK